MAHGRNLSPGMVRIIRSDADSYLGLQIYHDVSQKLLPSDAIVRPGPSGPEKGGTMNSREKGKAGELELARILREHGYTARRGQQFCGANGDADVVGIPGLHIECKRVEKLNIHDAMQQAVIDAREGEIPVVMHRKNRTEWLVTQRLDDWLEERRELDELRRIHSGGA